MKPLQVAVHFECSEALAVLLNYLQTLCQKDTGKILREKIMPLIHATTTIKKTPSIGARHDTAVAKKTRKSLMSAIMGNERYYASHSLFLQIEHYIHQNDSMDVQRCILKQMGSGLISKEIVNSVKKMQLKKIDRWEITKIVLKIFCLLLLGLLPIGFDVGTDAALLVKYSKTNANSSQPNGEFQGIHIFI